MCPTPLLGLPHQQILGGTPHVWSTPECSRAFSRDQTTPEHSRVLHTGGGPTQDLLMQTATVLNLNKVFKFWLVARIYIFLLCKYHQPSGMVHVHAIVRL